MSSSQSIEQLLAELRLQQRSFHVAELFLGFGACLLLCSLGLGLWLLSRQKVEAQAARAAASDAQQHMDVPTLKRLLGQVSFLDCDACALSWLPAAEAVALLCRQTCLPGCATQTMSA